MDWMTEESWFDSRQGKEIFSSLPTQPRIQLVRGVKLSINETDLSRPSSAIAKTILSLHISYCRYQQALTH
jgi:hypothetical protein